MLLGYRFHRSLSAVAANFPFRRIHMFGFGKKKKDSKAVSSKRRLKVGLALSGGGARGFAHIGAFKAFSQEGISFDYVAGTSVGSIMGAMYAAGYDWQTIRNEATVVTRRDLINKLTVVGSDSANVKRVAERLLADKTFADLSLPFTAVAVDIESGDEVHLTSGVVADAVAASSAVPILFTPYYLDGKYLVDGGLLNNMPADVCRNMGADVVISVDLNSYRGKGTTTRNVLGMAIATWNITTKGTVYKGYMSSDVVITPDLREFKSTRLEGIDDMIQIGYDATMAQMDEIKRVISLIY